ncbi:UDP-glucose pyrophosphorylase [Scenedesmus sp. NREL 46B-D3]|nr:UDP-glucose pyrophosphorylase [Scenedesmus sp. NREL 46B-D3]
MSASNWEQFVEKMKAANLSEAAIAAFKQNYDQLVAGVTGLVPEADIEPAADLPSLAGMASPNGETQSLLSATAVLKLNGGLGTSMGLEKAKSLLEVKDGKSFLDLIAEQVKHMRSEYGSAVKFILMNSFSTSADTRAFLAQRHADLLQEPYIELMQNKSPKVDAASLAPVSFAADADLEWCPPGHGDIYPSLLGSGMLDKLIADGIRYLFVSNSDNLGATLDLQLLHYFAGSGKAFMMEVCERTAADKKGGHLARRKSDGKFMLRESAMCPDADKGFFEDISRHRYFNTNNLWVNLPMLKATLEASSGALALPLIKNKKTVNPRDSSTPAVFQLETAMGSAIECFEAAGAVVVPRTRFAPVKTTSDLFVLRSDVYTITPAATVEATVPEVPLVKLDDKYFKLVDQMERLTPRPPSLVAAKSLTVKGPVRFGAGVVIKGDVTLECAESTPVTIQAATYSSGSHKVAAPAEAPGVPAGAPAAAPAFA